jgi:uncharacterized protein
MPWEWPAGAVCAFLLALITTPAGVSCAVLLLPVQLSLLHVPSPAVTPTNLLFNVAAVPGGLLRFWRERRLINSLTFILIAGTLPGVIGGAVIRVELLSGSRAFTLIAPGALLPIGLWLLLASRRLPRPHRAASAAITVQAAFAVNVPDGKCASAWSLRSRIASSTTACWRCSASTVTSSSMRGW